jgi:hypothetical protein
MPVCSTGRTATDRRQTYVARGETQRSLRLRPVIDRPITGWSLSSRAQVSARGLSLYGSQVASIDSNAFSYHGRRVGRCPHGVVRWEANCPVNARDWWRKARARVATTNSSDVRSR